MADTQVLIVGAGPTGLTLAVDLGKRGIRCTLIEQKEAPQFLPKMERCNARTMEIYRRMGLADRVRAAGLPTHCSMDVFIVLSLIEPPLLHLPYPSVDDHRKIIARSTDGSEPLEALSASLAIHHRAAAEGGRRGDSGHHGAVRPRARELHPGRARRRRTGAHARRQGLGDHAPTTWSDATAGERGAQAARHRAQRRRQPAAAAPGALSLRRALRAHPIGKGRHYHVADAHDDLPDRAGTRPGISPCMRRSTRTPTWRRCSRRPSRCR